MRPDGSRTTGTLGRGGRLVAAAALLAGVVVPVTATGASPNQPRLKCSGDARTTVPFQVPVTITGKYVSDPGPTKALGYYVAPKGLPRGMVVFSHGHGASPHDWFAHMRRVAKNDGVVAIAMYYPGETATSSKPRPHDTYGWRVREGAQAGIAAAKAFLAACPKLGARTIVNYGVSMGGNTSGLMAAAGAKRPGGRPLFDHWFDIEGATNVVETYLEAQALAAAGGALGLGLTETAKKAIAEIEQENGGTLAERPDAYADLAVVTHAAEIAASGVKGVTIVHGVDDGQVPYNQSREMQASLAAAGVGSDFYSVARDATDSTDPGDQIDGALIGAIYGDYDSPLAGHGGEGSQRQLVIQTGLRLLDRLFRTGQGASRTAPKEFLVDGELKTPGPLRSELFWVTGPGCAGVRRPGPVTAG